MISPSHNGAPEICTAPRRQPRVRTVDLRPERLGFYIDPPGNHLRVQGLV